MSRLVELKPRMAELLALDLDVDAIKERLGIDTRTYSKVLRLIRADLGWQAQ